MLISHCNSKVLLSSFASRFQVMEPSCERLLLCSRVMLQCCVIHVPRRWMLLLVVPATSICPRYHLSLLLQPFITLSCLPSHIRYSSTKILSCSYRLQSRKLNLNLNVIWYAGSDTATSSPSSTRSASLRLRFGRVISIRSGGAW